MLATPWSSTTSTDSLAFAFNRHNALSNFLFADGHVKDLRMPNTVSPVNMWGKMGVAWYQQTPQDINDNTPASSLTDQANVADSAVK